MSTEHWTDDRLDQLARLVEANARQIESNSRQIESNSRTIQALADLAAEDRQERVAILQAIHEMQQEIRGLQTENRRILDLLFNERRDEPEN
ncbi:hypothetical protein [Trichothermofontia sp.]